MVEPAKFLTFTCSTNIHVAVYRPKIRWKHRIGKFRFEIYQLFYWIFYTCLTFANNSFMGSPFRWWEVLLTIAFVMAIIYSIVYVFLRHQKSVVKTSALFLGMFVAYASLFYMVVFVWHPPLGDRLIRTGNFALGAYLFTMFLHWYHSMVEAGLLAAIYRVRREGRIKEELMQENHRLETQFLLAQMEPHEQYNMLDLAYGKSIKNHPEITSILIDLKHYTQFIQQHAKDFGDEIPVAEEFNHCELIITINKRRFSELYIDLEIPKLTHGWHIPPFSVSAVLKNALKYGISWDKQEPITISVVCSEKHLSITCRNAINFRKPTTDSTGLGNDNLRQRLKLLYDDHATLETLAADGWYTTVLTLNKP